VLGLPGVVTATNAVSLGLLIHALLHHQFTSRVYGLSVAGPPIWATNVLTLGLLYWELDRGGRDVRAAGHDKPPDFLFPQMTAGGPIPRTWRPQFLDYQYLSLTNSTAFCPTDPMPLTGRAMAIMAVQSVIALMTVGVVIARAINALR